MKELDYQQINSKTWDRWVAEGIEWGKPISHETYVKALGGEWDVLLTPTKPVPHDWFPDMAGAKVLGLASGGGQQMPIFSALGADCTVLDYSDAQLESERMVAAREGYDIRIVKADMSKLLPFPAGSFDLIFHPVSNCYVRDVYHVWRECFRVLKPGGILLAGVDNGLNYLVDKDEEPVILTNKLPFDPLTYPEHLDQLLRDDCGIQFSHSLTEQLGGQLKAGLALTHLYEDVNTEGALKDYVPNFIATRAVKP